MKYLCVVLLLLGLGCSRTFVETTDAPSVVFTTDKRVYASQEGIRFWIENKMPDPILVRDCTEIERRLADQWKFAGHWGGCQGTFNGIEVGGRYGRGPGPLGADYAEGTYRFAIDVLLAQDWEQNERVVTEAFTLTR